MLGCPIRKSADQWSFAPTRGLSQLITSFIACKSQGIRHTPFPTLLSLVRVFCLSFPPTAGGRRKTVVSYTFSCTCEIVSKEIVLLRLSLAICKSCFSSFPTCQRSLFQFTIHNSQFKIAEQELKKVENNGFEPLTPCLQSRCSSQLS